MALALDPVVVLVLVRAVLVVCMQLQEVEAEVVVVATMVALGMVVDLVQVQALASILKARNMAMMGILDILTPVVMEVVVAEDKREVTLGLAVKVVAVEPALALAKLEHTGMDQVMQMQMPMATVKEKALLRMVAVAVVKVVELAMVMQTLRSSTSKKMEPNLFQMLY